MDLTLTSADSSLAGHAPADASAARSTAAAAAPFRIWASVRRYRFPCAGRLERMQRHGERVISPPGSFLRRLRVMLDAGAGRRAAVETPLRSPTKNIHSAGGWPEPEQFSLPPQRRSRLRRHRHQLCCPVQPWGVAAAGSSDSRRGKDRLVRDAVPPHIPVSVKMRAASI